MLAAASDDEPPAIALRRPANVGSRAFSTLLGEERTIISETRDDARRVDTAIARPTEVILIDTAGIEARQVVRVDRRALLTLRSLKAISRADVAVLLIDAVDGLTAQDAHIAGYVVEEGKGLVVAVNKWDAVEEKKDSTFDQYVEWIRHEAPFLDFAPIVSISARTGQRIHRVLELAVDVWAERRKRVPTGELNRILTSASDRQQPPIVKGKRPKLFYATQASVAPPTFVFFAREAGSVHFSYQRYLENRLRDVFGFLGTPIRLVFRERAGIRAERRNTKRRGGGRATAAGHKRGR
jgi:GTP-binding protein